MSNRQFHQDIYDVLHDKEVPRDRRRKILHYFNRVNFFSKISTERQSWYKWKNRQMEDNNND